MDTHQEVLPSSIPRSQKVDHNLSQPGAEWLYAYCASCGCDGGRFLKADIPNREEFGFYLCNDCAAKYGNLPGTVMVPDQVFYDLVKQAQIEREGRLLEPYEMIEALKNSDHYLSKLANDRNTFLASE